MLEVVWTCDAGAEDLLVLKKHGHVALRRVRLLRLIDEALEQGGEATQEDLARALSVGVRTVRGDIAALKTQGYLIHTRGHLVQSITMQSARDCTRLGMRGAGRGQTHKVLIVELYLKRHTYTEIMRQTRHSVHAVKRYLQTFARVLMLTRRGLTAGEIAHAVGISERLTHEYLDLYHHYDRPEYQGRLDEMVQMLSASAPESATAPKKGVS